MISRKQLLSDKINKTGGWNFRLNGTGHERVSLEIKKKIKVPGISQF